MKPGAGRCPTLIQEEPPQRLCRAKHGDHYGVLDCDEMQVPNWVFTCYQMMRMMLDTYAYYIHTWYHATADVTTYDVN